ncbi:MAG: hypothetical protein ACKV2Q_26870, partial [Planctomycetaceae bacterium]
MNLLEQIHDLRRRVRRLLWLNGLSWAIAGLLCGVLLIGVGDWLWHFDDRGLRAGLLASLVASVGWLAWRRLVSPLRSPLSNVELSGHLEQCFPDLRGRLATAVEFLERGISPAIGSPELQRRLIEQTTSDARSMNFADVLDQRESRRAALTLAAMCGVALMLVATNSAAAATAIKRLLLSDQRWPKSVELQLVNSQLSPVRFSETEPLRSLQGQPLDLFVINARGSLPQPVQVEFRQRGHLPQSEPLRVATLRDAADVARDAAAIRLPIDTGLIEFRASGGDDHEMRWHKLWITPPPKLESFRVQVLPPSYTGEAASTLPEGATQVRAVLGSRLKIKARATRPISSASWDAGPNSETTNSSNRPRQADQGAVFSPENNRSLTVTAPTLHRLSVSASGLDLELDFTVQRAGSTTHRLSLTDRDQFENPAALRLEVIGVADPPPVVSLDEPATDQLVTANGTIRVQASVRDDRKLREIQLESLKGSGTSEFRKWPPGP